MADEDGDKYYQDSKRDTITAASQTRKESITNTSPYPGTVAVLGYEMFNLDVLHQGALWVDGNHRVWSLTELKDSHLDGIITWLDAGREYLASRAEHHPMHRDHPHDMVKMPIWKALVKEQNKRLKQDREATGRVTPEQVIDHMMARIILSRKERRRGDILTTNLIRSIITTTIDQLGYELRRKE